MNVVLGFGLLDFGLVLIGLAFCFGCLLFADLAILVFGLLFVLL